MRGATFTAHKTLIGEPLQKKAIKVAQIMVVKQFIKICDINCPITCQSSKDMLIRRGQTKMYYTMLFLVQQLSDPWHIAKRKRK